MTVFWTEETIADDMENLKAAIRATFQEEALQEDPKNERELVSEPA
jgi:hypothetical protein